MSSILLLAGACSDGDDAQQAEKASATHATTTTTLPRPPGPAAALSEEIKGAGAPFIGAATSGDLEAAGYVEQELLAAGTATSYTAPDPLDPEGIWSFQEAETAPYRTRVLVRRPADPEDFSGTVVVEWLNVSGGVDANPDYASLEEEILREGHAWVGVSAQLIGVEGGPVLVATPGVEDLVGKGLVNLDPERYATLDHPGDGFSFDMFSQVARAVRDGAATAGVEPEKVIAVGESQSAMALVTYYNGVQPLTRAFDGFFVHSRASVSLPLVAPGEFADLAGSIGNTPVTIRTDLDAPVLMLQAEGDVTGVLDSLAVRQADSERFRLWEVAGTAHADAHLLGPIADSIDCGAPINDAPMHVVAKAALRHLVEWVDGGEAPPAAPWLETTSDVPPAIARDADGIALGGIRTPPVDVPIEVLSGEPGSSPDLFCLLMGSTTALPAERIAELHPSAEAYEESYGDAVEDAVAAGFVLDEDRAALEGYADPSRVSG